MKVLLISVVFLLGYNNIQSQTHPIKYGVLQGQKDYIVEDKFYKFEELGFLFQNDEELSKVYKRSIKNNKVGKVFGYTAIGLCGAGVLSIAIDNNGREVTNGDVRGLILIIIATPISGIIGLVAHIDGLFKRVKVVDSYNRVYRDNFGRDIEMPQLSFAKSGLGITINF